MHYGTFRLSFEDMDEPPRWLRDLAQKRGFGSTRPVFWKKAPGGFLSGDRFERL